MLEELDKLDDKGYLTTFWEEYAIYDDTKVIALSDYGKVQLFKIDRADEVEKFKEKLRTLRYDVNVLDDFLLKQDLELGAFTVLLSILDIFVVLMIEQLLNLVFLLLILKD